MNDTEMLAKAKDTNERIKENYKKWVEANKTIEETQR